MSDTFVTRKKLIEVALPLDSINSAAAKEKDNPFLKGHPRNLHQWWARRPQAAARALIFAQLVDDPSGHPETFRTPAEQDSERQRLFELVKRLAQWENSDDWELLSQANDEIWRSWRGTCAENHEDANAKLLFNPERLPVFADPFAGGGALPLEAQRLGLVAHASDLNPVAVLISKVMIEIAPTFSGRPPTNRGWRESKRMTGAEWQGVRGLAEDLLYYGRLVQERADAALRAFYPPVTVTQEMAKNRPDLTGLVGTNLPVVAYIWARTVKSPNPAFRHVDVPLAGNFMLSNKSGSQAYLAPIVTGDRYRLEVRVGKPSDEAEVKRGTKARASRTSFECLLSGTPISFNYLREEAQAGRMGAILMAVVAAGPRGRLYLPGTLDLEDAAMSATPKWMPETEFYQQALGFRVGNYGMTKWSDLFTNRQLLTMSTFVDLVRNIGETARTDAISSGMADGSPLRDGGAGALAYSEALTTILALCLDKLADYSNAMCTWNPTNQNVRHLFANQRISMNWDFAEASPSEGGLSYLSILEGMCKTVAAFGEGPKGLSYQQDARTFTPIVEYPVVATDPPYYDNVGYADLSDFFYVWLRRIIADVFPDLFATVSTPKAHELVATTGRHGGTDAAEEFFLTGMSQAMKRLAETAHPAFPLCIYYAFKQSDTSDDGDTSSTGWATFLEAVIRSGLSVVGTWPVRTERGARSRGLGSNALASSIVLVCRARPANATTATRQQFAAAMRAELPLAVRRLQEENIAPVDLAQSAIGPGMAVFTRYAKVLDTQGNELRAGDALAMINSTLDEVLAEQEGDFDADTRWAVTWFDQVGFGEGPFGSAETLSKAKGTAVDGMVRAGIVESRAGKVRLLKPSELAEEWNPIADSRLTVWEGVHYLVRALESGGERSAAELAARLGSQAEIARELAYRLFTICERKKRAQEALSYNALVQSWPEIVRLARDAAKEAPQQGALI